MNTRKCGKDDHDFVAVVRIEMDKGEYKVVRWCRRCGSIAMDHEIDGTTIRGYYMKLRHPLMARPGF